MKILVVAVLAAVVCGATAAIWYQSRDSEGRRAITSPTTAPSSRPVLLPRNDLPGLENFAQVSPDLFRGEQPTAEGFRQLKQMGVKTVVNLRSMHSDRDEMKGTGLGYLHIIFNAWHPEDEDVVRFLKLVQDPANHPVFVHCQHGADRTGMMVAIYRVIEQGWTIDQAMAELPRFGYHPVWKEIRQYLEHFDAEAMRKQVHSAPPPSISTVR